MMHDRPTITPNNVLSLFLRDIHIPLIISSLLSYIVGRYNKPSELKNPWDYIDTKINYETINILTEIWSAQRKAFQAVETSDDDVSRKPKWFNLYILSGVVRAKRHGATMHIFSFGINLTYCSLFAHTYNNKNVHLIRRFIGTFQIYHTCLR